MIKVWCEQCEGEKKIIQSWSGNLIDCPDCIGQGYTEHEGTLEDLELAQAVKLFLEQSNAMAVEPSYDMFLNLDGAADYMTTARELKDWYREQKGGK